MPVSLTLATLVSLGACESQRDLFAATFPDGLLVSGDPPDDVIERIVSAGLDVAWLTPTERPDYRRVAAAADAEYDRVTAAAWADYRRVTDAAYAAYTRAVAPAYAEYERARAAALAEYDRARAAAYAEYDRVMARTVWGILAAR